MAPAYKLTYFNVDGLAESIRFLFSYGGIDFEDIRYDHDKWAEIKPTVNVPLGVLPALEHKGKIVGQSLAIARYVAKQVKLTGKNDWEDLEIDATADALTDWRLKLSPYFRESDEAKKAELKKQALLDNAFYLNYWEAAAKNGKGYLVLGRLTWVDILFTTFTPYMKDSLANYPTLTALKDKVLAIPNIKKWVDKHPKADQ